MTEETILRIAEVRDEMKSLSVSKSMDLEQTHIDADNLLCELLTLFGCEDIATDFNAIDKWYA